MKTKTLSALAALTLLSGCYGIASISYTAPDGQTVAVGFTQTRRDGKQLQPLRQPRPDFKATRPLNLR